MSFEPPSKPATPHRRQLAFAAQELRLISALVLLLAIGLFLALPFVLSIGSVVFLPVTAAIIITIVLAPLADRLADFGLPNFLAALLSVVSMIAVLVVSLALILQPAMLLVDRIPEMVSTVGTQFKQLQGSLRWIEELNRELAELPGNTPGQRVILAGPTFIEEVAFATPSVILEVLLTFLMSFFMVLSRVRHRGAIRPDRSRDAASRKAAKVIRDVQERVSAYILTVSVINLGVGLVVTFGAWVLGLEAPIMWGGLAALLNFLPYVGPLIMMGLLALFGLGTAESFWVGLIPVVAYLSLHTVESNFVTPSILGARFTMNPVLILIALSYFSWVWGVTGALLSVPILLTITALVEHMGRPNLVGFIFGEPLFATNLMALTPDTDETRAA